MCLEFSTFSLKYLPIMSEVFACCCLTLFTIHWDLTPSPPPNLLDKEEQNQHEEGDFQVDESKEDVPVEEPRERAVQEEAFVEEPKSQDWAFQVEE